jgi:hypothetical protein
VDLGGANTASVQRQIAVWRQRIRFVGRDLGAPAAKHQPAVRFDETGIDGIAENTGMPKDGEGKRPAAARTASCTYRRRFFARRAGLGEAGRTGAADVGWGG